jgi:hypothetical protein
LLRAGKDESTEHLLGKITHLNLNDKGIVRIEHLDVCKRLQVLVVARWAYAARSYYHQSAPDQDQRLRTARRRRRRKRSDLVDDENPSRRRRKG